MAETGGAGRWRGELRIGAGWALYVGHAFETDRHAHHAYQICVGLEGRLAVAVAPRWRRRQVRAAVVAPDVPHGIDAGGGAVALLYLEPESDAGRRLLRVRGERGLAVLEDDVAGCLAAAAERTVGTGEAGFMDRPAVTQRAGAAGGAGTAQRVSAAGHPGSADRAVVAERVPSPAEAMLELLGVGATGAPALDTRIEAALAILRQAAVEYPTSSALARRVGCSAGRFRHLFREQVGLAYRTYLLWLRLGAAVEVAHAGGTLTDAAHAAGFSDSAHLSRTHRRMFGVAPSALHHRT